METNNFSLDWDISGTGLVLSGVGDSLLISESSLVGDDWDLTSLSGGDWDVFNIVNSVESGLLLSSVFGDMLNSGVFVENSVVSGLAFLSVENLVLVGVSGLWLISVGGDGVRSRKDLNFSSVSVLFFLSVENFVVGFV